MERLNDAIKYMTDNPTERDKYTDGLVLRFEEAVTNNREAIRANKDRFTEDYAFKVIRLLLPERKRTETILSASKILLRHDEPETLVEDEKFNSELRHMG